MMAHTRLAFALTLTLVPACGGPKGGIRIEAAPPPPPPAQTGHWQKSSDRGGPGL